MIYLLKITGMYNIADVREETGSGDFQRKDFVASSLFEVIGDEFNVFEKLNSKGVRPEDLIRNNKLVSDVIKGHGVDPQVFIENGKFKWDEFMKFCKNIGGKRFYFPKNSTNLSLSQAVVTQNPVIVDKSKPTIGRINDLTPPPLADTSVYKGSITEMLRNLDAAKKRAQGNG